MRDPSRSGPLIELVGAAFSNKGAELMLRTAIAEIESRLPSARFAMSLNRGSPAERRSVGAADVVWRPSRSRLASLAHRTLASGYAALGRRPAELMPDMAAGGGRAAALGKWWRSARAARSVHSVLPAEVDVVVDVSGYAYGDAWGWEHSQGLPPYYRTIRRRGGRVILLPQTLGPFEDERVRRIFQEIYAAADLVYARDDQSFERAAAVLDGTGRLRRAPDITIRKGDAESGLDWVDGKACVIPNCNMTTHLGADVARSYAGLLERVLRALRGLGAEPFLLIHDLGGGDERLAREAAAAVGGVEIVREADPYRIKAIIGRSFVTVSSRYHGLVAALSQGVPSLATGWAHKYETLLADYRVPEALLDPLATDEVLGAALQRLFVPDIRRDISRRLLSAEAERVRGVERMWDEVMPLIAPAAR
jgi:colanic acid/amylovoran biosynthesis protein